MIWLLVLILVVGFVLVTLDGLKQAERNREKSLAPEKSYYTHKSPLTENEINWYNRLRDAYGDKKIILAQVAFSSFIKTAGGDKKSRGSQFAKMRQKVADFVICSNNFEIECIIEIDDKTHDPIKDKARDKALNEAGIHTARFMATSKPTVEEILEKTIKIELPNIERLSNHDTRKEPVL